MAFFGPDHTLDETLDVAAWKAAQARPAESTVNWNLRGLRRICVVNNVALQFAFLKEPKANVTVLTEEQVARLLAAAKPQITPDLPRFRRHRFYAPSPNRREAGASRTTGDRLRFPSLAGNDTRRGVMCAE